MNNSLEPEGRTVLDRVRLGDVELKAGDTVRLWPLGRADIFDIVLQGKTALIESIERDFEDRVYVAVVIADDPGQDFGLQKLPGHRFFFGVEEVELLKHGESS